MADDETESAAVGSSAEEVTVNTVSANEEPMIEIPLMTGSQILKMRVSLTDFCKLPIRDIGVYNSETVTDSTIAFPMLNSSFCIQIGSASSCVVEGDKVVRKSVSSNRALNSRLPTQIGIAESGEVRTDFPFDDPNLSKKEKQHLQMSTLMPPILKTQSVATVLVSDTDTDMSSSFVFGEHGDPSHVSETSLESQDPVDMTLKRSSGSMMMMGGGSDEKVPEENEVHNQETVHDANEVADKDKVPDELVPAEENDVHDKDLVPAEENEVHDENLVPAEENEVHDEDT